MPDALGRLQTGVSIVLRDALDVLEPVRDEFDPAATEKGIPLHVTLLFPFVPPDELTQLHLERLRTLFASRAPLSFDLVDVEQFPGVVYARPQPDADLLALMGAVWAAFPETPPYGGAFDEPVPHATLGRVPEGSSQEEFVDRLTRRVQAVLPLPCRVRDVSLLEEHEPNRWRERCAFPLTGTPQP